MGSSRIWAFIGATTVFSGFAALVACAPANHADTKVTRLNGGVAGRPNNQRPNVGFPQSAAASSDNRASSHYLQDGALREAQLADLESTAMNAVQITDVQDLLSQGVAITGAFDKNNLLFTDSSSNSAALNISAAREAMNADGEVQAAKNVALARRIRAGAVHINRVQNQNEVRVILRFEGTSNNILDEKVTLPASGEVQIDKALNNQNYIINVKCAPAATCDNAQLTLTHTQANGEYAKAIMVRRLLDPFYDIEVTLQNAPQDNMRSLVRSLQAWKDGAPTNLICAINVETFTVAYGISTIALSIDGRAANGDDVSCRRAAADTAQTAGADTATNRLTLMGALVRERSGAAFNIDLEQVGAANSPLSQILENVKLVSNSGQGAIAFEFRAKGTSADEKVKLSLRPMTAAESATRAAAIQQVARQQQQAALTAQSTGDGPTGRPPGERGRGGRGR